MSDLDQWWNAPQEAKALTEDNLRQALEQWLAGPTRPEPRCLQDEEGRWMIVSGPHPPPKQPQRERDKSGGTGLPGESVGGE